MVFVVAEIGVNWDGNIELAKEMIHNAQTAGCNAVKFQAYTEDMVKTHPEKLRLMKATITKDNVESINQIVKSVGIEWFCTPMYPKAIEFLDPFVKRFKIREFDGRPFLKNKTSELLEKVMRTDKELIVSCQTTPKLTKFYGESKIKWLYCVPKYPCLLSDLNFKDIKDYNGYSNHCQYIIAPLTAAILGAQIIEIHITSDKSKKFVDNAVSFDYSELNELVQLIRFAEQIIR
jgi:sialic acid synthase SpsE